MSVTINTTAGVRNCLTRQDFATSAFICNAGNLLEPTIFKGTSLTGNGSSANPLAIKISADAGNDITFGTDGGIFLDVAAFAFSFDITDGVTTESIASGDTITFVGTGAATATVSAVDTVTINVPTGANFSFGLNADAGIAQTITQGETVTITGGASIATTVGAVDTVTVDLQLSTDVGQNLVFGTDGNVLFAPATAAECPAGYFVGAPV